MAKKLARNTTVGSQTFEAGSTPPKEVADLIDNAKVWEEEEVADITPADDSPAPAKRSSK